MNDLLMNMCRLTVVVESLLIRKVIHKRRMFAVCLATLSGAFPVMAAGVAAMARGFDCIILPTQIIEIRSPVVGLIDRLHVQRGDSISKDQVLVTLDSGVERSAAATAAYRSQARGALEVAKRKLQAARDKADRLEALREEDFVSAQQRDDAVADARMAEAELQAAHEGIELAKLEKRQAEEALQRRTLRSPVTGVVMDTYLFPGSLVESGDQRKPILKVAQTDALRIEGTVPLQHFRDISTGSKVTIVPEPPFDRPIDGRIKKVDKVIDPAAGTFGVVVEIDNSRQTLPGGVRCKMSMEVGAGVRSR